MERELTIERTRDGLEVAKAFGRKGGCKRTMTDSKIASAKRLLLSGAPPRDVAKDLGVSLATCIDGFRSFKSNRFTNRTKKVQ